MMVGISSRTHTEDQAEDDAGVPNPTEEESVYVVQDLASSYSVTAVSAHVVSWDQCPSAIGTTCAASRRFDDQ